MNNKENAEEARQNYWSVQMEAAYRCMSQMQKYPVEKCGEPFVFLPEAVKNESLAVSFSSTRLAGKYERLFI